MSSLFLALFLLVFGLNMLLGLSIPIWVLGVLACVAGVLILMDYFRVRIDRK
jgi:antibiotic biosynthesis monooxygenase (ABM) superfamily enzyme